MAGFFDLLFRFDQTHALHQILQRNQFYIHGGVGELFFILVYLTNGDTHALEAQLTNIVTLGQIGEHLGQTFAIDNHVEKGRFITRLDFEPRIGSQDEPLLGDKQGPGGFVALMIFARKSAQIEADFLPIISGGY